MYKVFDPVYKHLAKLLQLCEEKGVDAEVIAEVRKGQQLIEAKEVYLEEITSTASEERQAITQLTLTHPFDEDYKAGKCKWNFKPKWMSGQLEGTYFLWERDIMYYPNT